MMRKLHHSSFWRGRSFTKSCAQHLLDVRNYTVKLQKNLAGNRPQGGASRVSSRE